MFKIIVLFLSI